MVDKYVGLDSSGHRTEVAFKQTSAGAGDAGKGVALDSGGLISSTMLPTSGLTTLTAFETIAAGDMINLFNDAGTVKARKADNTNISKRADGFAPSGVTAAASGAFNVGNGANSGVTGLTVGAEYFLGVAGAVTPTPVTAAGTVLQRVGVARTATELDVLLDDCTIRA